MYDVGLIAYKETLLHDPFHVLCWALLSERDQMAGDR